MRQASNLQNNLPRIQLFGQLCVLQPERSITRFRTKKAAELLAYLAYYRNRQHAREALIEILWPDEDIEAARNRLSVELNSLRRQLEPPGVPAGAILRTDRTRVQLNPEAYSTDVAEFEAAIEAAGQKQEDAERAILLASAVDLYAGELLPGYYTDWILTERERLADAYFNALRQLTGCLARLREFERALDYARRAVQADPLREASYRDLMRLYSLVGRPAAALELYAELERLLKEALSAEPSMATQELVAQIQAQVGKSPASTSKLPSSPTSSANRAPIDLRASVQSAETSPPVRAGSLPLQFTRFFGRETEMASVEAWLSDPLMRLLTLSGPGGSGKTRLSIEVGRRMRESFPGGVWFVPLADLFEARLIVRALQDTLRLPQQAEADPLDQIVAALSLQPSLLILDNFEQVAAGGAPVVRTLLKRVESLKCLVTSRRTLRLLGEREFPVPPLPVPQGGDSPEQLLRAASAQLFVDRAQAARPDFQVTTGNARDVALLCADLEGIPLAIELAAARAKALTPAQIRERLSERFALLATRRMDKSARHRSLWAAIDWSYHLLPPALQRFFARLSVFRGGWTLEAAEGVCEEALALDYLAQLQGHSLITAEESTPELHFRMLESLRDYAAEQLEEKEQRDLARRHRDYFLELAQEANHALFGPKQVRGLDQLEREHDNLRAALEWCLTDADSVQQGLRLAATLCKFWDTRGFLVEGFDRVMRALAAPGAELPNANRALALNGAGNLARNLGDFTASRRFFEEGLALYQALDDRQRIAMLLGNLAMVVGRQGDHAKAYALMQESLSLRREVGDKPGIALTLNNLGNLARKQGDFQTARALLKESLALYRELGDLAGMALVLSNLGNLAYHQADYADARAFQEQSLELRRQLGDKGGIADTLGDLGIIALDQGQAEEARALQEESLALRQELGERAGVALALGNLSVIAIQQGDYSTARPRLEESLAIRRQLGDRGGIAIALANLGELAEAEGNYAAARGLYEESLQTFRQSEDTSTVAIVLCCLGKVLCLLGESAQARDCLRESMILAQENGDRKTLVSLLESFAVLAATHRQHERAARLYGAAEALRAVLEFPRSPFDRDWASFHPLLAETALSAAWEEGRAWTPEQAISYALEASEPIQ